MLVAIRRRGSLPLSRPIRRRSLRRSSPFQLATGSLYGRMTSSMLAIIGRELAWSLRLLSKCGGAAVSQPRSVHQGRRWLRGIGPRTLRA